MAKKVLVKDNKVLSLHSGKVLGAPENYDLDTYLNFHMPFGGTITLRRTGSPTVVELEYSTDGGQTWHIWEEVGTDRTLTLPQEGRMWIRNTSETSTGFSTLNTSYYCFIFDQSVFAYGDIRSLVCKTPTDGVATDYCFNRLFYDNNGTRNLLTSPKLTFTEIPTRGYFLMFCGCQKLQRVITYMTDISASYAIYQWLSSVSYSGHFYCDPNLTIPTGVSGIPTDWTRHDLSELNN